MINPILKWALRILQLDITPSLAAVVARRSVFQALRLIGIAPDQIQVNSQPLESIFSTITLNDDPSSIVQKKIDWQPLDAEKIVYPKKHANEVELNILEPPEVWDQSYIDENLALALIEKYGTFLSISPQIPYISFYDVVKSASAVHDCLEHGDSNEPFLFLSGDFSGIQDTIYTISSKGALKTLRARSFMLELLTEHITYEIQQAIDSSRYSVIFSGGGGFGLLVPNTPENQDAINTFMQVINEWIFEQFGFQLFLAFHCKPLSVDALENGLFRDTWELMADALGKQKQRKFWQNNNFKSVFCPKMPEQLANQDACQITHRDDLPNSEMTELGGIGQVTKLAYRLWQLGDLLTEFDCIVRFPNRPSPKDDFRNGTLLFPTHQSESGSYRYAEYEVGSSSQIGGYNRHGDSCSYNVGWLVNNSGQVRRRRRKRTRYKARWLVNNWDLGNYDDNKTFPFLFGKYVRSVADLPADAQKHEKEEYLLDHDREMDAPGDVTASFSGLAKAAQGSDLIGCLRMDVDNSGDFFSQGEWKLGLGIAASSNLSRSLNLFFTGYLSEICAMKLGTDFTKAGYPIDITGAKGSKESGREVSIIYAGGDDLFIVGAWDDITELTFDINASFRAFACDNPQVHLSGGVTLHKPKFPLYQMARMAKQAEDVAKHNEIRNRGKIERKKSLALFYSDDLKMRNRSLNERIDTENDRTRVHGWIQEDDRIAVVSQWEEYSNVIQLTKELNAVYPDLPHGFYRKLFETLRIWQEEGQLYMPMMHHTLRELDPTLTALKTHLFRQDQMPTLHIPLHWVGYLNRQKEGGD